MESKASDTMGLLRLRTSNSKSSGWNDEDLTSGGREMGGAAVGVVSRSWDLGL